MTTASENDFKKVAKLLNKIPPKAAPETDTKTAKYAVTSLFDEIAGARQKGYSFYEIRDLLVQHLDIKVEASTVETYWYDERKARQASTKKRTRTKAKSKKSSNTTLRLASSKPQKTAKAS